MNKRYVEDNHSSKKVKGKDKGKSALMRISKGLSDREKERLAKHSK